MTTQTPQQRTIRGLLLDLDGTLVDTAPDLAAATSRVLAAQGLSGIDAESLRPHVTSGARGMVRAAAGHLDDSTIESLARDMVDDYAAHIAEHSQLYPGLSDCLQRIESRGVPWGVVTNKFEHLARALLDTLGLHYAVLVGGDTCAHRKPHPAPILHALDSLDCAPADVLYVGDAETDIQAARAAGCVSAAAGWGYGPYPPHPGHIADWQADYALDSGHALHHLLDACTIAPTSTTAHRQSSPQ